MIYCRDEWWDNIGYESESDEDIIRVWASRILEAVRLQRNGAYHAYRWIQGRIRRIQGRSLAGMQREERRYFWMEPVDQ